MAFEMLAGRPPFMGPNPQALLAAQVSQAPQHVSQLRPAVPQALDSLVMRCLEKRAADRWQHASELLPYLDLLMTPSTGGSIPTSAVATISAGTEAALRRSSPARVLATFVLGAAGALAVVWLLVRQLGLPNWVLIGGIALLIAGLPIILLAGRQEHKRALARTTNSQLPTPTGIRRLFTWRGAMSGGALAFVGLGVLAAGYMGMRHYGIGSFGSLIGKGRLQERDRIVLADFENRTPDSTLAATVTELLRTDLAQSRSVSVYDQAQLASVVALMRMPAGTRINFDVAKEVATREGLKAVLAGEVAPLGSGYVLSARLVETKSGDLLWTGRENAPSADALAPAIDRLSAALRERVGESLRLIRADPPLERMTTNSIEALRLYTEEEREETLGHYDRTDLLERAIALDSNFAMAYRRLGMRLWGSPRAKAAFQRAYALRERLSTRERYLTEAAYFEVVKNDIAKTIAAYRSVLDQYPGDDIAGNNLGILYSGQGRLSEALAVWRQAVRSGTRNTITYGNAIDAAIALEGLDSARELIEAFAATFPNHEAVPYWRASLLFAREEYDSASVMLEGYRDTRPKYSASWAPRV